MVHGLLRELKNKGHIVIMDNLFFSMSLFINLLGKCTYTMATVGANRIGHPIALAENFFYIKYTQWYLEWIMYKSKQLSVIVWVDKKLVLVISTVTPPIHRADEECPVIERRVGYFWKAVETPSMYFWYTRFMRGVGFANQHRGEYFCQIRTKKWWYRLIFFLLDIMVVDMSNLHSH